MTLVESARRLTAVLREENAALEAMDFARAGALLAAKHAAADALAAACKDTSVPGGDSAELRDLAALADANRLLLNRALRVQRRVLEVIARAARHSGAPTRYGTNGKAQAGTTPPRSLLTRI